MSLPDLFAFFHRLNSLFANFFNPATSGCDFHGGLFGGAEDLVLLLRGNVLLQASVMRLDRCVASSSMVLKLGSVTSFIMMSLMFCSYRGQFAFLVFQILELGMEGGGVF